MRINILIEPEMEPIPSQLEVSVYGQVRLRAWTGVVPRGYVTGRFAQIKGEESTIREWLKSYDNVWVQKPGTACAEEIFEMMTVKR